MLPELSKETVFGHVKKCYLICSILKKTTAYALMLLKVDQLTWTTADVTTYMHLKSFASNKIPILLNKGLGIGI